MSSLSERLHAGSSPVQAANGRLRADPLEPVKRRIIAAILEDLGPQLYDAEPDETVREARVTDALTDALARELEARLTRADRERLARELRDEILGHGPIEPLLRDPSVSEIMVNGPGSIWVERAGQVHPVGAVFAGEDHLRRVIDKIVARVGRRIDDGSPMVDARLPDGSRVNAVVHPVALDGSLLTIRKFPARPLTAADLTRTGTWPPEVERLLRACVAARLNIVISGGTGSGKTTTLNVLSSFIPPGERIITIEDAAELQLRQDHVLRMEARPPNLEGAGEIRIRALVRNALRMRPDRIIVGEVRDEAALDMLQAMNTGHEGSVTTVHANSPADAIARLETMVLMAEVRLHHQAVREQIASAIHLVVHQARMRDHTRKITRVSQVAGMEDGHVRLADLLAFDHAAGRLRQCAAPDDLAALLARRGMPVQGEPGW